MIKKSADETFVWSKKISCWNVDLYEIDDKNECWRDFVWSDQIKKESAVKMMMIKKKSIDKKNVDETLSYWISCWFWCI